MRRGSNTPGQPEQRPAHARKLITLSGSDDTLLRSIYRLHFLTAEQVTRLLYSPGSLKYVRVKLKELAEAGFLHRLRLPHVTVGNTAFVYTLGRKGIAYLTTAGFSEFKRFRPSEQDEHSYLFLSHTLAVNDVLIAATRLQELVPEAVLADFQHERTLRSTPVTVTTAAGETIGVVPDAWMDWHLNNTARMSIVLELDRGTIEQRAFRRKLRALLTYSEGPYQEFFHTESLTVAVATTAGEHRCTLMRTWCEHVLKELKREQNAELFLFTALPLGEPGPKALFLDPVWHQPFKKECIALLEL